MTHKINIGPRWLSLLLGLLLCSCSDRYGPPAEVVRSDHPQKEAPKEIIPDETTDEPEESESDISPIVSEKIEDHRSKDDLPFVKDNIEVPSQKDENQEILKEKKENKESRQEKESKGTQSNKDDSSKPFDWPARGKVMKRFGEKLKTGERVDSLILNVPEGNAIRACASGKVKNAGRLIEGYGAMVILVHTNGKISIYTHMKEVSVKKGQSIKARDTIGKAAKDPFRFQVRANGKNGKPISIDPMPLLKD